MMIHLTFTACADDGALTGHVRALRGLGASIRAERLDRAAGTGEVAVEVADRGAFLAGLSRCPSYRAIAMGGVR